MEAAEQSLTGNTWEGPLGKFLPLIEAKMVNQFDHRFSTYEGATQAQLNVGTLPRLDSLAHADPLCYSQPAHWVNAADVNASPAISGAGKWLVGYRAISTPSNARFLIAAIFPTSAVGNSLPFLRMSYGVAAKAGLVGALSSFAIDYAARQKATGTNINMFFVKQLPAPQPSTLTNCCFPDAGRPLLDWLLPRIVELTYTAWDLEPFGVDCGYAGPPFVWDEERRFLLRAELDAAFFHRYLGTPNEWSQSASDALKSALPTTRDAVSHIMETFPIVKKKDLESFGTYRTKDTILEIYDEMTTAIRSGQPYQTRLAPPPADLSCRHAAATEPA